MPKQTVAASPQGRGYKGRLDPVSGRFCVSQDLDFGAVAADLADATSYTFDFQGFTANGLFDQPRSVFIDNSVNPNQLFVNVSQTLQNFPVAPYTVGMFPIMSEPGSTVELYSIGGATDLVTVEFYNTREVPWANSAFSPLVPGFDVQAQPPKANAVTLRNFTLAAGVAHDVFPAVATPRMIRFRNMSADVAWFRIGNNAAADFTIAHQLDPGSEWITLPYMTADRISFFSGPGGNIEAEEVSF